MELTEGVMYKFETKTCTVCKMMEPLIQEFQKSNPEVIVQKIDPHNEMDLCEKFGISNLPTFLYMEGDEAQMLSGMNDKKEFNKFTKQFLKTL